jgi:hypothetical protein
MYDASQERLWEAIGDARRALWALLGVIALTSAVTTASVSTAQAACANEARRMEQDAGFLPDCRAYELVTPPGGQTYAAEGHSHGAQAASAGGQIAWYTYYPPKVPQAAGQRYLSTRGESGWTTASLIPPQSPGSQEYIGCQPSLYFSDDLAKAVLSDGFESIGLRHGVEPYCGHNEPSLVDRSEWEAFEKEGLQVEPEGAQNLLLRDTASGAYRPVNLTPVGAVPGNATFEAASAKFEHIAFAERAQLTADALPGENLYEWTDGAVKLVTYLPDGQAVLGSLASGTKVDTPGTNNKEESYTDAAIYSHAMSSEGPSRIVFTAEGRLYQRINAEALQSAIGVKGECTEPEKACTVQLDASQAGGPGGGGTFLWATASGGIVFFADTSEAQLTSDSPPESGLNLYEYDGATGTLSDLAPVVKPGLGLMGVAGLGESGGTVRLYAVATAVLSGAQQNSVGTRAEAGKPNLYVIEPGRTPVYIATLDPTADATDWGRTAAELEALSTRVSANGRYIVFDSVEKVTGYDNRDASTSQPDSEIYLYDADTGSLACVSCAVGQRPTGPAQIRRPESTQNGAGPGYVSRHLLNDGRVFFDSPDALSPLDSDGATDVYEYDLGEQRLISSGASTSGSFFVDASAMNPASGEEGEDAFFLSSQRLVGGGGEAGFSLYDARSGGGFPEPAAGPECAEEGCRGAPPSLPGLVLPSSATFSAPTDVLAPPTSSKKVDSPPRSCRAGTVRRNGRCRKKRPHALQGGHRAKRRQSARNHRSAAGGRK